MIMKFLHSNEKHILTTNLFVLNKGCQAIFRIHRITELWMDRITKGWTDRRAI